MSQFVAAACQMDSQDDKQENIDRALGFVDDAAAAGADFVALPEMMSYIGPKDRYPEVAESVDGELVQQFADKAREHDVYVHTGSFFERIPGSERVYNTSVLLGPEGNLLGTYRKVHLFDIEIDGDVEFEESARVAPGDEAVTVETDLATFGLSICYDLRFPVLYQTLAHRGANVLLVPSAFTMFTGKDHWEPLLRARAIETQSYVIAPGQIGDKPSAPQTYGRTMIVDPWGNVVSKAKDQPETITATLDFDYLDETRRELQSLRHARSDVYELP